MQKNRTKKAPSPGPAGRGSDVRSLLRSRAVQALLAAAVAVQGVATLGGHAHPGQAGQAATEIHGVATVTPAATNNTASTAAKLAEEYREKGYQVTDDLAKTIVDQALDHGITPDLAFGLVATESEFKRTATSPVGAIGLAQLMPATAKLIEPGTTREDLETPETNLRLGFRFLHDLLDHYQGDTALALTAYNRGPGIVDDILEQGGDPDNGYAEKVMGD